MIQALKDMAQQDDQEVLYKRVRISVDNIYRNEIFSINLSRYLMSLYGIQQAKANPITGRILVVFNESVIHEYTIKEEIFHFTNSPSATPKTTHKPGGKTPYHVLSPEHMMKTLKTDFEKGLSKQTAQKRLQQLGANVLSESRRKSLFSNLLEGLNDICVKVLLGSSVVSLFLGQVIEAIALGSIVFFQVALGAIQKSKSETSLNALQNMLIQKAKVIRDGKNLEIDSKQLVPGDIILLESGDKVPADARIISCEDLKVNESSLTGESIGVSKSAKMCPLHAEMSNRHNMLYMGTNVLAGIGKAVVVSTGKNTEIGKIATLLEEIAEETTPLENKAEGFISTLIKIYIATFSVIGSIALLAGMSFAQVLMMGVTFFLGAIPEGLPITVTTCMVLSVRRMAKKNAVVRHLKAVENLGAVDVVCCDKTGTLTLNEMTVRKIYTDGCFYNVSGVGYSPLGEITPSEGESMKKHALEELLKAGVLCNNASLVQVENKWEVQGDPTEGALIAAAGKINLDTNALKTTYICLKEVPFDSQRRYMLSILETKEKETYAYCKGALDTVLEKCSYIYENGKERLLTNADRKKIQFHCNTMAEEALRTLAFSYKKLQHQQEDIEKGFVFLGFVGMEDPPREGVKESIKKCLKAGIKVVMITGDHMKTASAIGRQLGLLTEGLVVCGSDLDKMNDKELDNIISKIQVFARTTPEQKYRIVKALKRQGHIVAMTGDGVNDAPAIKEAHIGIAMGLKGSDVARDAACITLVDDDFSTIVAAIEEGRGVVKNIKSTMKYLFAGAIGEMLAILLSFISGSPVPFLAIQMIWINLVSETLLGSTLAVEPPSEEVMLESANNKPPVLIDRPLKNSIIRRGLAIGISTFALFKGSLLLGASLAKAQTLAFTNFICCQIVNLYDSRSNKSGHTNLYMHIMTGLSAVLLIGILYLPSLNALFGTVPLDPLSLLGLAGGVFISRG
ncbi:cation-translocating P-type ATPase [Clostridium formicaceticum]|uniref:Calcium-transporting ATPase n=1 Tax=Clostridium formicaceticum TaxID=1497 RepID=A0AAC9WHK5_9CLOT|nr:cation-transporting P-type ATPase [Clostridium formicaceticum]AOY74518.1 haloacid dehalogenase [Clostridium formicaceticum]ARE88874.1 Calcium-transporting ATPase [Clostridium formicaceticum]